MSLDELVKEAKLLSVAERKKLLEEVARSMDLDAPTASQSPVSTTSGGRYAKTLALAGTLHTDYADVSTNKYKHLGEIYADNHEDE